MMTTIEYEKKENISECCIPYRHISVMKAEVLHYLNCRPGKIYADCTLGGSGHASAVLEKIMPEGLLIGMDQDMDAVENAKKILEPYTSNVRIFHSNFIYLSDILLQLNIKGADGILLDLGLSLYQIEGSGRGFSFRRDEPLDMRMDTDSEMTAGDLINGMDAGELEKIFRDYGEERWARRIARKIVIIRKQKAITSSSQLAQIVCDAIPSRPKYGTPGHSQSCKRHPATRVFMAIRIAVNRELERLDAFMEQAVNLLNPGGRLCVLSFHSLEDRIVKHRMKALEKGCICPPNFPQCVCKRKGTVRVLTRKAQTPAEDEILANPMARSTKLRAVEKLRSEK